MKYLFKALFNDNSIIEQTQEDKSPTTEGKNCFYDVLNRLEEIHAFALYNQETQDEYLVDLHDGHFEVNKAPFKLHGEEELHNLRLIYFKRNVIQTNCNLDILSHDFVFIYGFQANRADGKNVEFKLSLQ